MPENNPQVKLIGLALKELEKVFDDLKKGKTPEVSSTMKQIASELEAMGGEEKKLLEEDLDKFSEELFSRLSKKKVNF